MIQLEFNQRLIHAATELLRKACAKSLFDHVMVLSQKRIHGRLQSAHWNPPGYRSNAAPEPLYQEIRKVSQQLTSWLPFAQRYSSSLVQRLDNLCESFRCIDKAKVNTNRHLLLMKKVVIESYDLCTLDGKFALEGAIRAYGLEPRLVCNNKCIQQVDKIGRYWGLCVYMAKSSVRFSALFKALDLKILPAYQGITPSLSTIQGKRVSYFVHAEIQLVTFYGLCSNAPRTRPRVLGVSKSACYLCSLFLLSQGQYFITKTHGRLYNQWNVPDLAAFGANQVDEYRRLLATMHKKIREDITAARKRRAHRDYPLTSTVNLPKGQTISPLPSDVGTLISDCTPNIKHEAESSPAQSTVQPGEQRDPSIARAEPSTMRDEPVIPSQRSSSSSTTSSDISTLQLDAGRKGSPVPHSASVLPQSNMMCFFAPRSGISATSAKHASGGTSPQRPRFSAPKVKPTDLSSTLSQPRFPVPAHSHDVSETLPPVLTSISTCSLSTIVSCQSPIDKAISSSTPLKVAAGKLFARVEFEGLGQGQVTVQHTENGGGNALGIPVDVGALPTNQPLLFERAENDDRLVLLLRHRSHALKVDMRWV